MAHRIGLRPSTRGVSFSLEKNKGLEEARSRQAKPLHPLGETHVGMATMEMETQGKATK